MARKKPHVLIPGKGMLNGKAIIARYYFDCVLNSNERGISHKLTNNPIVHKHLKHTLSSHSSQVK